MAANGHEEVAPVPVEVDERGASPALPTEYNPNLSKIQNEIEEQKTVLERTLNEIRATADRLTSLRVFEQTTRDRLTKLECDKRAIHAIDTKVRAQAMQEVVLKDEDKMRKLQTELEKLQAHKETAQAQLKAVQVKGHLDGVSAGAPMSQVEHNLSVARYELKARPVASGLSHDTLAQTPADVTNAPADGKGWGKKHDAPAASILDIGNHASASPYVNPSDYVVTADRPKGASESAKFSDWRSPSRNSTRVAQPPGGYSHMNSIFG
eukprot:m.32570 g.32570  ORF g.32570 m.32570 type:complete len:266 (+) comp7060_c0_seq1:43-840(+)